MATMRGGLRQQLVRGSIAGLAGGAAMLLAMAADQRVAKNRTDDRLLAGGMVTRDAKRAKTLGTTLHFAASAFAGGVYATVVEPTFRGPGWAKGAGLLVAEHLVLYPPFLLFEAWHPMIQQGELDTFRSTTAFTQETTRHIAFGMILGITYDALNKYPIFRPL